jgi:hypothetical protein
VDWRQVVEHVRRSGQTVTGQQMLTDKFRWAPVRAACAAINHSLLCLSQVACYAEHPHACMHRTHGTSRTVRLR